MSEAKNKKTVIERFLLPSADWQEGYRSFNQLFGRPLGWLYIVDKGDRSQLIRLDRKDQCSFFGASKQNQISTETFLRKYCEMLVSQQEGLPDFPAHFKDAYGKNGIIFALRHLGKLRAFLLLTSLKENRYRYESFLGPFRFFLSSQLELAYKNFELNNFYETVHPRALALSTMHSVHRVISASIRLKDLLPRIGRLSAQVIKAQGCSIMLVDGSHDFLMPAFSFGSSGRFVHKHRVRIGRGLEGKVADTGEFHFSRRSIAVPFIEEDIVGVICLWDKVDRKPFTKTDLEILKSLSEQAVTAIKNAQLFEETEQLTLGSIKTINELLELKEGSDRTHLPFLGEIVMEIGRELQLSGRELIHIQRAIMLRDTGALAFPEKLFKKTGKLTKKELATLRKVPIRGASLLSSISSLKPVLPIILHHRERFDGQGYPQGLQGEQIPIGARIVAVVDSFLAMISERAYRDTMSIEQALREVQAHSGTQFDPRVVDCFIKATRSKTILDKLKALIRKPKRVPSKGSFPALAI